MNLDKEIEALESTLIRLKQLKEHQAEPIAKWQPKGGGFMVWCSGDIEELDSINSSRCFGTERETKEQAERAAVEMRRFNRLLALRDELCEGDEVDWQNGIEKKYSLYYSHERGEWELAWNVTNENIQPYFTSLESAEKACDMLNSGEVEL